MVSVYISVQQRKKEKKTLVKCLCAEAQLDDGIISQTEQKVRVPEHPACSKRHSYESGHTPMHSARFCNPTKRAWGCQARAPTLHGVLSPRELGPHAEPAGMEAFPSSLHSDQATSGQANGTL